MDVGGWALEDGRWRMGTGEWAFGVIQPWKEDQMDIGFHLRCKDLVQTTYKAGLHVQS